MNNEQKVNTPVDNAPILELKNVRQYFQSGFGKNKVVVKAVHNVSFDVKKGEVFGLVGESGCGKTTTGRSVIKLYNITDGTITFKGTPISQGVRTYKQNIKDLKQKIKELKNHNAEEIAELKGDLSLQDNNLSQSNATADEIVKVNKNIQSQIDALNKEIVENYRKISESKQINKRKRDLMDKMQMIFQDPIDSLDPRLTVKEIIAEGMYINGIKDKDYINQKVNESLELVGLLPDHASRYPHEFSGGQRQRIGIARALVVNPELIIADEPISALDVSIQAQIINLLNDIRHQMGLSILFIAHNLSVVKFFCDRIGVMYYGRLVEIATAEELFAHPLHPYTKSLLSAVPLPDPDYEKNRKRIFYNPRLRPYSEDKPLMTEIRPGHFVYASLDELARYEKELNGEKVDPDPTLIELD